MAPYERWFLEAVLEGLELQRQRVEEQIAQLNGQVHSPKRRGRPPGSTNRSKKRTMSAEGRERIAAAQRKRWKAFHKQQAAAGE